jgi:hypothetical protein
VVVHIEKKEKTNAIAETEVSLISELIRYVTNHQSIILHNIWDVSIAQYRSLAVDVVISKPGPNSANYDVI